MDKTNYPVLSIVAVVAIVAIVAIFLHARTGSGIRPITDVGADVAQVTANAVVGITGNIVAQVPQQQTPRMLYDFNRDGKLDVGDADVLGRVIDRVEFCPRNMKCDVNDDNFVDIQDLGTLNALILTQEAHITQEPQAEKITPMPTNQALTVGALGVLA